MSQITEDRIAALAVSKFKGGLYCSEAILQAFNELCPLKLDKEMLKIATAFGTGFGGAKCVCGSITGGQMVISLIKGRTEPSESETPAFEAAKSLHDAFKETFKASCCRVLTRNVEWGAPEHHESCTKYVEFAARKTYNLIKEDFDKE